MSLRGRVFKSKGGGTKADPRVYIDRYQRDGKIVADAIPREKWKKKLSKTRIGPLAATVGISRSLGRMEVSKRK